MLGQNLQNHCERYATFDYLFLMHNFYNLNLFYVSFVFRSAQDIEAFCSGGKNGFIFFSLGTVFREETLPDNLKQMFINVFSRLKTRVLWKWGSEIKGLPEHIKVSKWLPQADLLGKPG